MRVRLTTRILPLHAFDPTGGFSGGFSHEEPRLFWSKFLRAAVGACTKLGLSYSLDPVADFFFSAYVFCYQ